MTIDLFELEQAEEQLIERELYINLLAKRLTLAPDPAACFQVLTAMDMEWISYFIDSLNPSKDAPYHGAIHTAALVVSVYEAIRFYSKDLSVNQAKALIVAASMQNYNHTAGKYGDDINQLHAIDGIKHILKPINNELNPDISKIEALTISLIRETGEDVLCQSILHDANQMMPLLPHHIKAQLYTGLYIEETHYMIEPDKIEFATDLLKKYSEFVWQTSWAKEKLKFYQWNDSLTEMYWMISK